MIMARSQWLRVLAKEMLSTTSKVITQQIDFGSSEVVGQMDSLITRVSTVCNPIRARQTRFCSGAAHVVQTKAFNCAYVLIVGVIVRKRGPQFPVKFFCNNVMMVVPPLAVTGV